MTTDATPPPDRPRGVGSPVLAGAPSTARGAWRTAQRWGRCLLLVTIVGTALAGAMVTPVLGVLVIAPALGALLAGATALVHPGFSRHSSSRRSVVHAAIAGVLLVPFTNGVVGLGNLGDAILLALVVVGPLVVPQWTAPADDGAGRDVGAHRALVSMLPTAELLREWEATGERLRTSPDATAAESRELLLDELSRRDPEGVAAWLAAGDTSPQDYVRPGGDLAR